MEEPSCITSYCLICESQISPTHEADDTDTRALISILKKILLQQNEADVKVEKQNSEAIRLFCPACTGILNEWHEIQDWFFKLLTRSKDIKYRLIAYILESNVSLPGQLQGSAAIQYLLKDFAAVKRAVINEYRPSLQLERLAEIPLDALRNCFGRDGQNDTPADLLELSLGLDQEDYHDDWEAPTFDAAETNEFQHDDLESDGLNRKSSSISRHVMTTRKRRRSPTEQCDGRTPKEKRILETDDTSRRTRPKLRRQTSEVHVLQETLSPEADESGPKTRSVVTLDNGDILYSGIYTIKLCGNKYLCPLCGLQRVRKNGMTEHIREDHIRGKGTKEIIGVGENTFLYRNQYGFIFNKNRYKCTTCGTTENKRQHMIDHLELSHINGGDYSGSLEHDTNGLRSVENSENTDRYHAGCSDSEKESEQDSDNEAGPITQDVNPPSGPKRVFKCVPIAENVLLYAGKYRIVLKDGRYRCPKCSYMTKMRKNIRQHIRENHIKCAETEKAGRKKQTVRSVVELDNGDILYDGKYTLKWCGNKYLCPLCAVQRTRKNGMTEHIREDHIRGKGTNEIIGIGQDTFLYLNKYGFTFSDNQYKCTTCRVALPDRASLTDHIRFSHVNRADRARDVSKVKGQPTAPSWTLHEEDVSEADEVENTEEDPDWYHPDSSDNELEKETFHVKPENETSEVGAVQEALNLEVDESGRKTRSLVTLDNETESAENSENPNRNRPESSDSEEENEEDSDGEQEPVTEGIKPPIGPRSKLSCVEIAENIFMYAGKYRIVLKNGLYKCPKCSSKRRYRLQIMQHIREKHMKCVMSDKLRPRYRVVALSETEFMYGNKYRIKNLNGRYFCSECSTSCPNIHQLTNHIRYHHIWKFGKDTEPGQKKITTVTLDNGDFIYDGKYTIKLHGKVYLCPLCAVQSKNKSKMTEHIREEHIRENGPTPPVITPAGENTFLYLNQYEFTFSNSQYQCTTCGIALARRQKLIDHIQFAHVNGTDQITDVSTVKSQPNVPSSSLDEEDVNGPESVENNQDDPDWNQADSSDSEAENETENETSEVNVLQEALSDQLAPEVSVTENSQPTDIQLPSEVSETFTIETSQPEGSQLPPHVQPHDVSATPQAIENIEFEAVKSEAVHIQPENQSSEHNVNQGIFNAESDETVEKKRIRRSVVVLKNGDILYDGKYTIKLYGKKYLCPVCGMQRTKKSGMTDHILQEHIVANAPTTPEVTAVGENSFLYLNQYGFSCSNDRYKCTTCGITLSRRRVLFDHMRVSHVKGADKTIIVGKGRGEPEVQSSSPEDAHEPESMENTEEDPDWHQTDSSDIEAQSEQDSDDDQVEPGTTDTSNPPSGPRKQFTLVPISENEFMYAGKYRVVLKDDGRYRCPKCSFVSKRRQIITQHIREIHLKCVVSQKVRPFNRIVTISENEFMYSGKYRITKMRNRYFCSECPKSRPTLVSLSDHIRQEHVRKKEVPEATPESEGQSSQPNHEVSKIGPNEYLYGGQVRISINDGVYTCGSCGIQKRTLILMRHHAALVHIERSDDEFYKSVKPLKDGTFKCGKCDFIGRWWAAMSRHIETHKKSLKETGSAELRKCIYSVEVSPNHFDHGGWPYIFDTETSRFNCGSCKQTFPNQRRIIRHIGVWHRRLIEAAICDECGKTFGNKDLCRQHKARHRPKTIPCPECGKLFVTQDLKGHMKTHLGEAAKAHVCEFCGKRFYKLNQLEKHRSTHTGEAPYSCDDCGLGYWTQRELKNHQKTEHPKETVRTSPHVGTNHGVVSIETVDGVTTDVSSM